MSVLVVWLVWLNTVCSWLCWPIELNISSTGGLTDIPFGSHLYSKPRNGFMVLCKDLFLLCDLKAKGTGRDCLNGGGWNRTGEPNISPLHHFMSGISGKRCIFSWQCGLFCSTPLVHEIRLLGRSCCTELEIGQTQSHRDTGNNHCLLKSSCV